MVGIAYTCNERTSVSFKTAHKAVSGWKYLPSSINNEDKITRAIGELFAPDIYLWQGIALGFWWKRSSVSFHRFVFFFKYDYCLLRNINESLPVFQILSSRAQMLPVYSFFLTLYSVMQYRIMFNKISAFFRYSSSHFFFLTYWMYFKSLLVLSPYEEDENGIIFNLLETWDFYCKDWPFQQLEWGVEKQLWASSSLRIQLG